MRLVKDARRAWRWFSMQAMALQVAAIGSWLSVPDDLRAAVPPDWLAVGALVLTGMGMIGRVIDQGGDDA